MEQLKLLALVIILFPVTLYITLKIYSAIIRLFKKKSHHYTIPPSPEKDPNWNPITFSDYNKLIFIDFKDEKIKENLDFSDKNIQVFQLNNWTILKGDDLNFSDYNLLIFSMSIKNEEGQVIGFCQHHKNPMHDYVVKLDVGADSDEHFIGSFRNNKNFGIYLPNIDENPQGNISLSRTNEISFYHEIAQIPIDDLENIKVVVP